MTLSVTDLLTPVSQDQARATFVTALESLGVPASQWRKGGVASTILTVAAISYAGFSSTMVAALSAGFLETATGSWLRILAKNVYGVDAIAATFASGQLTLTNSGGGIYDYGAREFTVLDSVTKQTYVNVDPLHIGALSTVSGVDFECTVAGSIGTAAPGDINALVTQALGVSVTNPLSFVGLDDEPDADLRTRCLNKLAALSVRGPRNAYVWAATSAVRSDGAPANVNRVSVSSSSSTGTVSVWIASPSGAPDALDIAAVEDSIEQNVRPEAVTVTVTAVTTVSYSPAITVYAQAKAGLSAQEIQDAVAAAITSFISTYPIGGLVKPPATQGYLFASAIEGVVKGAHASIYAVDGATDLALNGGQVAVDAVPAVTVRLVSQ